MSPRASGLVGDWVAPAPAPAPAQSRSTDTTLLRFGDDGTVAQLRIKPSEQAEVIPWGPFRVYADSGPRQLLCFSFRRGRARPGCRYFEVDTLTDAARRVRRELRLLNWVEERQTEPEIWTEKTP